ncbi:KTSC domain-containing protein [Pedobacter sp. AW31-3R]|uniref:KTSC domain-containing protein n=1 Tax=Pedobacter sp. AW31-3R TaxID=3445781 RepID=UPI003F9FBA8F
MPSTVIKQLSYDPETRRLKITFLSGRVYSYKEVPPEIHTAFSISGSKGRYFNAYIKNRYAFDALE